MPTVNNIEQLRKWFRQCPALSPDNRFRVDYMAEEPTEYSLYAVPSTIKHRKNVLGEFIPTDEQRINYIFASKEVFGADERQNIRNAGFCQDVINWIIEQNKKQNFPRIEEGCVMAINPTLTGYAAVPDTDSARYQISLEIVYERTQ